jgi:hypothetical protein
MTSSDWQLEQTGVDRVARRLTMCAGSVFELNGLRSKASLIFFPLDLNSTKAALLSINNVLDNELG